jgi:hypothetical protein
MDITDFSSKEEVDPTEDYGGHSSLVGVPQWSFDSAVASF